MPYNNPIMLTNIYMFGQSVVLFLKYELTCNRAHYKKVHEYNGYAILDVLISLSNWVDSSSHLDILIKHRT